MSEAAFPKLFREYHAIHDTIHAILSEDCANKLDVNDIAQRVLDKHPEINMDADTLAEAIRQAIRDIASTWC